MNRVNIVYTNGIKSFKVYWISQHGNNMYHGFHLKIKQDFHFSHHKEGKNFITIDDKSLPTYVSIPISEIKDIYNLHNFNGGDMEWMEKYYCPYKNEKLENIVWVDTRLFPNDIQIQVELYLIRPEFISVLATERFRRINEEDYRLIQVIQNINPWLIIQTRNLKYIQ